MRAGLDDGGISLRRIPEYPAMIWPTALKVSANTAGNKASTAVTAGIEGVCGHHVRRRENNEDEVGVMTFP